MLESKDGKIIEDGSAGTDLEFKCSICLKKYFTREDLGTHMKTSHLEKLVCEFCDTSLSDKKQLSKHISNIHGAKNIIYKCEVCNLEFKLKPSFEMHMKKTHQGIKDYKCDLCPKDFFSKGGLDSHLNDFHKMGKIIECDICKMTFTRNHSLKNHISIHHTERETKIPKVYKCEQCERQYVQYNVVPSATYKDDS